MNDLCALLLLHLSLALFAAAGAPIETSAPTDTSTKVVESPRLGPTIAAPYELLQPDASWCGPRVLYFFTVYLGHPSTLDDVVAQCRPDAEGLTSLADLSGAAESLGLVPTPVQCSVDDLADFDGPAIVSIARLEGPVHFIGLLRCEDDKFIILDPSRSVRTYRVSRPALEQSFTGHAILLGDAGRLRVRWLSVPLMVVVSIVWMGVIAACLWPDAAAQLWGHIRYSRREVRDAQ